MTQGVAHQIVEHLPQSLWVASHRWQINLRLTLQCNRRFFSGQTGCFDNADHQIAHVYRAHLQSQLSGVSQREQSQVVHQPLQQQRLLVDRRHVGLVQGMHAVQHRLQAAPHDAERRAQLVSNVGDQVAAEGLVALQLGSHKVKGSRQVTDFVPGSHVHPLAQVTGCDGGRRRTQLSQRRDDLISQQSPQADAQRPGKHPSPYQRPLNRGQVLLLQLTVNGQIAGGDDQCANLLPLHHQPAALSQCTFRKARADQFTGRVSDDGSLGVGQEQSLAAPGGPSRALAAPAAPPGGDRQALGCPCHHQLLDAIPTAGAGIIGGELGRGSLGAQSSTLADVHRELLCRHPTGDVGHHGHTEKGDSHECQCQFDSQTTHALPFG